MEISKWYSTIDMHSGGEPIRIITGGLPQMRGAVQRERAADFMGHHDAVRRLLMAEPRGHLGMTGAIVTPPASDDAHFGLLFMNNEGLAPISGHSLVAVVTAWLETGQIAREEAVSGIRIDCEAGRVTAYADYDGTEARSVTIEGIPSFVLAADVPVVVERRACTIDVAYSGAFYAVVDAAPFGGITTSISEMQAWGSAIRQAVEAAVDVVHPDDESIKGLHGVFMYESAASGSTEHAYRGMTIFADAQCDRSPGGTGACAHLAVLIARGELMLGEEVTYEGITGAKARCSSFAKENDHRSSIVPRYTADAHLLGWMNFVLDPSDPLPQGFILR
ncbi:proline racemase family protein [Paenibacillus methanolicus]|uniref:Trans-L-3-hydroxyproline dehydratase n=1 Tax=Paenibacillus methanolicus TaxID=582686 RepID=A0A5S5CGK0_9BACL|nr:proline racemase family protein [Paenibacillus methanolicus]TYP78906.1 trans-L-3-hydroxyproline dehydratase [Paenibacillus methanolicus]